MFGLPVWLFQLIIAVLKATGAIGYATALSARLVVTLETHLAKLKTYPEFPSGKNGASG